LIGPTDEARRRFRSTVHPVHRRCIGHAPPQIAADLPGLRKLFSFIFRCIDGANAVHLRCILGDLQKPPTLGTSPDNSGH
jgi:hypothetical protein